MPHSIIVAANLVAIALYIAGAFYLLSQTLHKRVSSSGWIIAITSIALVFHAFGGAHSLIRPNGLSLGLFKIFSLLCWVINAVVLISGLRKPLYTLFLFLFPISATAIILALLTGNTSPPIPFETGTSVHILLSIFAYSLLVIASLQALLLAFEVHQLKNKHPAGLIRLLPPLQTMEALFFELLWAGYLLLSMAIISGFVFLEDLFAQHLVHKTLLSITAWIIYSILLWGHHRLGWRGMTAVRWALGGFFILVLGFLGSKFVLEILLHNPV